MNIGENSDINLIKYYAFEPEALKASFVKKSQDAISEYSYLMKICQLYNFRINWNYLFEFDDLIYGFKEVPGFMGNFGAYLKGFRNLSSDIKIDSFLDNAIFKDIPCIREFFCYSTFPSVFYNFISSESFELGYNFIKNFFDEHAILPLLVSSFLLHSMLFQDRLISSFLINFINSMKKVSASKDDDLSNHFYQMENKKGEMWRRKYGLDLSEIKNIFYQSLKACTSYLSEYQIKIVQDLYKKDKDLAIYVISELFLKDIMKNLSKYLSISNNTNIISLDDSIKCPPNSLYIKRRHVLIDLYDELDFNEIIQIICQSPICYKFAKIRKMIINTGYRITLSLADIKIICLMTIYKSLTPAQRLQPLHEINLKINNTVRSVSKIFVFQEVFNKKDFVDDIFKLYFKQQEHFEMKKKMPKQTHTIDEMKKCKEAREVHRFLMKYSGHLNKLFLYLNATREIVRSRAHEFVNDILLKRQVFDPYEFELYQIKRFMLDVIPTKGLTGPNIIDQYNSISSFMKNDKSKFIFIDINKLSKNLVQIIYNTTKNIDENSDDYKLLQRFVETVDYISYLLYIAKMNKEEASSIIGPNFNFDAKKNIIINDDSDVNENNHESNNNNANCNNNDNNSNNNNNNNSSNNNNNDNNNSNYSNNNNNNSNGQNEISYIDNKMKEIVNRNTNDFSDSDGLQDIDDLFSFYKDIREIILLTNESMRNESLFIRSEFNIGQKIKSFVTIENLIEKSIKKSNFENDKGAQRFLFFLIMRAGQDTPEESSSMFSLDQSNECFFFRANLIKSKIYLDQLISRNKKSGIMMPNELWQVSECLDKLACFCNMKKQLSIE
ncbi:hypothetical protein M9Y10_022136 [Tritrichomonas musculus]|uniref:Uncharacterized protein n=1 Tax=Tritrichomonas musculus TaxID=1915356 RepID=A0ABR2KRE6_9EUKA